MHKIRDAIVMFHAEVQPVFSRLFASYVMDVVVFEDFSVQIIELNSFGARITQTDLFAYWKTCQVDRHCITGRLIMIYCMEGIIQQRLISGC